MKIFSRLRKLRAHNDIYMRGSREDIKELLESSFETTMQKQFSDFSDSLLENITEVLDYHKKYVDRRLKAFEKSLAKTDKRLIELETKFKRYEKAS